MAIIVLKWNPDSSRCKLLLSRYRDEPTLYLMDAHARALRNFGGIDGHTMSRFFGSPSVDQDAMLQCGRVMRLVNKANEQ